MTVNFIWVLFKYIFVYLYNFIHFKFTINSTTPNNNKLKLFFFKKTILFKKKIKKRLIINNRLTFFLKKNKFKKKKTFKNKFKKKNFFFKKHLFKTILKSRKNLKLFLNFNTKVRQNKITQVLYKNTQNFFKNRTQNNTIINILLKSRFFFFSKDALFAIKNNLVYLNFKLTNLQNINVQYGDCIQLTISSSFYKFYKKCKFFLKKKIKEMKKKSWLFFKSKINSKKLEIKIKKRKTPKYIDMLFLFKFGINNFIEVDFFTLSIYIIKTTNNYKNTFFYINKFFSPHLFSLYNFKKIN